MNRFLTQIFETVGNNKEPTQFKMQKYEKLLGQLITQISALTQKVSEVRDLQAEPLKPIYTNDTLKELLGVGSDLIKKYRDNGDLGFTKNGDKYWYSSDDVIAFLKKNHYKPFGRSVRQ